MNVFKNFESKIKKAVMSLEVVQGFDGEVNLARMTVEPPRDPSHGDISTNAAMMLAKPLKSNPRELATQISNALSSDEDIASVNVAGPGFINLNLSATYWQKQVVQMVEQGEDYGRDQISPARKINVEYVSANPTGPMHVGHCRGAVVGDALANLLAYAGHDVTKEYYINDAGAQINVLANSVYLRYCEALGDDIGEIPAGLYPGDYLVPLGKALAEEYGSKLKDMSESDRLAIIKPRAIDGMMDMIRDDLAALNIRHDVFFSERQLHENNGAYIGAAIDTLESKGLVYKGTLPPPKGQLPDDWEDREQLLFKTTDFGDDLDRPLVKSDGSYTYFAADTAYFVNKFEREFEETIFVLGADHGGYVKRMEALAHGISDGKTDLTVLLCQLVKLYRNGEPFKMSKRSGDFVTLRDVVDEVGSDSVRFMMLYRKSSEPLDFDFAKVTEQSKDNPVFYVQYAHARCHSVFRQAAEAFPDEDFSIDRLKNIDASTLTDETELRLIAKLAEYPRVIESAALGHEPHKVVFYLYDLASMLHSHWNLGKERPELRFINHESAELTAARLGLVYAIASILRSGLSITGTEAPLEMR
jgi:arginyl-tRNA synthetase